MTNIDLDADPHVPAGWSVAEHRKGGQWNFDPKQVELWYAQKQQNDVGIIGTARSASTLPVVARMRTAKLRRRTNPLAREGSTRRGRRNFDEVMRSSA